MLKYLNPALVLLLAFLVRILVTGATFGDALVIIGLSGLYGFQHYLDSKKEPVANKMLWDRVADLEQQLLSTRDSVNAVKLGMGFRK